MAKDVAEVLGISETNTITERLDTDEWGKTRLIDTMGREQETFIISESGLYAAISRSNKPEAKAFQRWVRKDVLPSIRKTGSYSVTPVEPLDLQKLLPEALRSLAESIERRTETEKQLAITSKVVDRQGNLRRAGFGGHRASGFPT